MKNFQNTRPNVGLGDIVKNVGSGIFNRTIGRLFSSGIRRDSRIVNARAKWSGRDSKKDWRVKLMVPQGSPLETFFFENNKLLEPLSNGAGGGGIFWPLTPSIIIQYSSNYNAMEQTHSNYPHYQYGNSQVDQMNIFGEFLVQNQQDAKNWVATVNFLRTATKMFFGQDEGYGLKGNPPPVFHLYGYGDHMFNKVPVIINTFNVELRSGIDYISTTQTPVYGDDLANTEFFDYKNEDATWAPTLSTISVLVTPIYSRQSVKNFSMSKFVRGELNGRGSNEIGFI